MKQDTQSAQSPVMVMWVIWFAIFAGLFIMYYVAAPKPSAAAEEVEQVYSFFTYIGIAQFVAAMIIRWLVVPRMTSYEKLIQAMVIGVALVEGAGIIGMFAVPADQIAERTLLVSIAVAGVLLSAPVYAKRMLSSTHVPDPT